MKKRSIIGILIAAIFTGIVVLSPLINNQCAYMVEKKLCETPLPEKTEFIESLSRAGKLTGNGMQYFGAILIESELSLEELDSYYSGYRENAWEYLVEKQTGQEVKWIEHERLQFLEEIKTDSYYIVYAWRSSDSFFSEFDLRGR